MSDGGSAWSPVLSRPGSVPTTYKTLSYELTQSVSDAQWPSPQWVTGGACGVVHGARSRSSLAATRIALELPVLVTVRAMQTPRDMKSLYLLGLIALAAVGCTAPAPSEAEGHTASHQLAGRVIGEDELAGILRQVGFDEATVPKMICTAKYESSFHEEATNSNTNGTTDYGVFQINSIHVGSTAGCPSTAQELLDATTNAQCALGVFNVQGLDAWVAYKSHRAECDAASAPAADPNAADPNADPNAAPPADPNGADPSAAGGGADPNGGWGSDPCAANPNDPACQGAPDDGWGDDPCASNPSLPGCQSDGWDPGGGWFAGRQAAITRRSFQGR